MRSSLKQLGVEHRLRMNSLYDVLLLVVIIALPILYLVKK
jgi:hypothetical protein